MSDPDEAAPSRLVDRAEHLLAYGLGVACSVYAGKIWDQGTSLPMALLAAALLFVTFLGTVVGMASFLHRKPKRARLRPDPQLRPLKGRKEPPAG